MSRTCWVSNSSSSGRTASRPSMRWSRRRTRSRAAAIVSGRSSAHSSHPATPWRRSATSPTGTETTGRSHASASLTTLGDPSCIDVQICTSMQEGSPNVVKEALACDLPVVSVPVGDVALRLQGVAGCELCADDRPETIAAARERVLRRDQRIDGRDAVRPLDEELLTQQVLDIYRSVVNGHALD